MHLIISFRSALQWEIVMAIGTRILIINIYRAEMLLLNNRSVQEMFALTNGNQKTKRKHLTKQRPVPKTGNKRNSKAACCFELRKVSVL